MISIQFYLWNSLTNKSRSTLERIDNFPSVRHYCWALQPSLHSYCSYPVEFCICSSHSVQWNLRQRTKCHLLEARSTSLLIWDHNYRRTRLNFQNFISICESNRFVRFLPTVPNNTKIAAIVTEIYSALSLSIDANFATTRPISFVLELKTIETLCLFSTWQAYGWLTRATYTSYESEIKNDCVCIESYENENASVRECVVPLRHLQSASADIAEERVRVRRALFNRWCTKMHKMHTKVIRAAMLLIIKEQNHWMVQLIAFWLKCTYVQCAHSQVYCIL